MVVDSSGHVATDTIKGNSTAGSISVVGEGGSTTTNLQQGLAKSWCQGNNAAALQDSFNCASGTDHGTGEYSYTFTNSFNNDDYASGAVVIGAELTGMNGVFTSSHRILVFSRATVLTLVDQVNYLTAHGDLA